MNKERRGKLKKAIELLEQAKEIIEDVNMDEEFSFGSLNEGLQATMRGQQMEDCIDNMNEAMDYIEKSIDVLEDCFI